jgi:hypothetical protein
VGQQQKLFTVISAKLFVLFLEGGVFRLLEAEVKRFDEVYTSTAVPVFQEERLHI